MESWAVCGTLCLVSLGYLTADNKENQRSPPQKKLPSATSFIRKTLGASGLL